MNLLFNFPFLFGSLVLLSVLFIILRLYKVSFTQIAVGGVGLFVGLLISALLDIFLSELPPSWGIYIRFGSLFLFGFGGMYLFLVNKVAVNRFYENIENLFSALVHFSEKEKSKVVSSGLVALDTSAIIDGRIEDVIKTGFISQKLLISKAVINELHQLSDSKDSLKRERGKRGLEILERIENIRGVESEVIEDDFKEIKEVDEKLIKIAKKTGASIMTVDYNLNKVAKIQKAKVLNVNELANSLRMVLIPGEEIEVEIVQEGKSKSQGVGFLPDGTMIVVEDAKDKVGQKLKVKVAKSFQTEAGRMIFGEMVD